MMSAWKSDGSSEDSGVTLRLHRGSGDGILITNLEQASSFTLMNSFIGLLSDCKHCCFTDWLF